MVNIKIGIISDTHISKDLYKIEELLNKHLKAVDLIIHAGDFKNSKVIDLLENQKKFIGVFGNNDGDLIKERVKEKELINIMGYKIGIYHGHGNAKTTIDRAYEMFKDNKVDIIIFGHSHQPVIKTINKILMLNPGSPTSKRKDRWYSYIILELCKGHINAQINFFDKL